MKKQNIIQEWNSDFPPLVHNCGFLQFPQLINYDSIKLITSDYDNVLLNSDFPSWGGYVILNFSAN